MAQIVIIYHSQTGHTEQMAHAVAEGVREVEGAQAIVKRAGEAGTDDLVAADGVVIGSPENFGYMAGMVKDFFDRTFYYTHDRVFRKPFAIFISAGNDGTGALNSIERIALGYKFKTVFPPVISRGKVTEEDLRLCRELGGTIAAGCQLGIF